ncbi:MAG: hypothetical protein ACRDBO_09680 [Lachnospiraceae bacterium]
MIKVLLSKISTEVKIQLPDLLCNLDVIISVGYRVKSKRGIAFGRCVSMWRDGVMKEYQHCEVTKELEQEWQKTI